MCSSCSGLAAAAVSPAHRGTLRRRPQSVLGARDEPLQLAWPATAAGRRAGDSARPLSFFVAAASGGSGKTKRDGAAPKGAKGKGGGKGSSSPPGHGGGSSNVNAGGGVPQTPTGVMRAYASQETLLFTPVPARPDAVRVVYAYPNTYTVGITSLGYQLVWAALATNPQVRCMCPGPP